MPTVRFQRIVKSAVVVTFFLVFLWSIGFEQVLSESRLVPALLVGLGLFLFGLVFFIFYLVAELPLRKTLAFVAAHSWYNMLPERWWKPEEDPWWMFYLKVLFSTVAFFASFSVHLAALVILFYLAGEPFTVEFGYLLIASSSALVVIRLTRYIESEMSKEVTEVLLTFILYFGLIAGILLVSYLGGADAPNWLWNQIWSRRQFIFILFLVYFGLDILLQVIHDSGRRISMND